MMLVQFNYCVEFSVHCAKCEEVYRQQFAVRAGEELPRPSLPYNWKVIAGQTFCAGHAIELQVDGEVRSL